MKKCKICGCMFDERDEGIVVNEGLDSEFHICSCCQKDNCDDGRIISCESCGGYFMINELHDEEINGRSFTACPHCGKDVVEGLTREQFAEEHTLNRYAVVVQYYNRSRGFIVSADHDRGVIMNLADRVDLSGVVSITYSQIILDEDEF